MNRDTIDFENGKIPQLFRKLFIPTLFGALSIVAVTTIDGIFVGHGVGSDGVAAVNIVVPIYQIMSGIGLMIGVGCSVVSSIHISQSNIKAARINITQALAITSLLAAALCVAVLLFPTATARILGASDTLTNKVVDYLIWIMPSFIFQMWSMIGLFVLRLDGAPHYAMWCNIIPATLNAILDWIFIFPLAMGVKGASIATSISIIFGGIMVITHMLFFSKSLRPIALKTSVKSMRLSIRNIGYQCKIGSSTMLAELSIAVFVYIGNLVFMSYLGDDGVGAFGIACYYTPFFFMIGNAIAQSAQPIISYNYGISRWAHVRMARTLLLKVSIAFGVAVTILFLFLPTPLVGLFVDIKSNAADIAIAGLPYFSIGVLFYIINIAVTGYYQSIKNIRMATIYVFLRGAVFLIPAFVLLPPMLGAKGIWLAMPLSEILSLGTIAILWYYNKKQTIYNKPI